MDDTTTTTAARSYTTAEVLRALSSSSSSMESWSEKPSMTSIPTVVVAVISAPFSLKKRPSTRRRVEDKEGVRKQVAPREQY